MSRNFDFGDLSTLVEPSQVDKPYPFKENSKLEVWLFSLIGIKQELCGQYDPMEQCCNDSNYTLGEGGSFCECYCPYGVRGYKRLPFTRLVVNLIRLKNYIYNYFKHRDCSQGKFKWL